MNYTTLLKKVGAGSTAIALMVLLTGASGIALAQTTTGNSSLTGSTYYYPTSTNTSMTGAATSGMTGASTTGVNTMTPGVPNTGAGGDVAENLAILGVTAVIAIAGTSYLARQKFIMR